MPGSLGETAIALLLSAALFFSGWRILSLGSKKTIADKRPGHSAGVLTLSAPIAEHPVTSKAR